MSVISNNVADTIAFLMEVTCGLVHHPGQWSIQTFCYDLCTPCDRHIDNQSLSPMCRSYLRGTASIHFRSTAITGSVDNPYIINIYPDKTHR
ncbi:MAG: hypothetical protein IPO26_21705 [Saprospiraceae bacterium]|nr:hypothetical protein [Saprospiraceae bacterium]